MISPLSQNPLTTGEERNWDEKESSLRKPLVLFERTKGERRGKKRGSLSGRGTCGKETLAVQTI